MAIKLIFGLRAPQATQLVIFNDTLKTLSISVTPNAETTPERCDRETWMKELAKGDYLVRVEGDGSEKIRFTVTPKAGIVSYKDAEASVITAGWALAGAGDPKNPWPPPDDEVYALDGVQWLTDELQKVRASLSASATRGHKDGDAAAQKAHESTAATREGPEWK